MRIIFATVASLLLAQSTQAQLINNVQSGCVAETDFDVETDYFPEKYTPPTIFTYDTDVDIFGNQFEPHNTTDLLEITYHKTYKIVYNKHNNVSYLLYQCGTEPPQAEVDSGNHQMVISVPHQGGIAITQTPQIPPIELLGRRGEIKAIIGDPQYVSSPCMLHMMEEGDIEIVHDSNRTIQADLRAAWIERNPEGIIFGGPTDTAPFADRTMNFAATQERTNVATFDWIAMYASLFNLEAMANQISSETQARYDCTSTNARMIVDQATARRKLAASAPAVTTLPEAPALMEDPSRHLQVTNASDTKILWATYFTGYNWSVADCSAWDNSFYCEYATHCGTTIINRPEDMGYFVQFGGPTKYYYINDDELLQLGKDADVFIFPSNRWDAVYEEKKELLDQIKAVKNEQVYDNQGSGSNAWFEQRYAEYDVVGLDMCDLVGTANPNGPAHERRWFRNIFNEPIGDLPACNIPEELTQPYVPNGAECEILTEADFLMESEITEAETEEAPEEETAEETEETPEEETAEQTTTEAPAATVDTPAEETATAAASNTCAVQKENNAYLCGLYIADLPADTPECECYDFCDGVLMGCLSSDDATEQDYAECNNPRFGCVPADGADAAESGANKVTLATGAAAAMMFLL